MKKVVLILPTYNEKENIETLVSAIEGVFQKIKGYSFRILVVDDESPDGTQEVVHKLMKSYKNISLVSKKKEGLGAAYMYGMKYSISHFDPDIFVQMDADWQHNPLLLPDFFKELEKGADFVIGSRYMRGGSIPGNWGLHRKIYSVLGNSIVRFGLGMLNPHDWTSGYRLLKTELFQKIADGLEKYSGYTFQVASLHRIKQSGFRVAEVPLQFSDRVHGRSKIAPFDYIKNLLTYIFTNSTFIKYVIVGVVGFSIQTLVANLFVRLINPGVAVSIGSFFAIVSNFIGNNLWTFSHKKIEGFAKLFQKFIHFLGTSFGAVIIQGVVVGTGVFFLGDKAWFPLMIFAIVFLVIPYNYFIYNKFIWKTKKSV